MANEKHLDTSEYEIPKADADYHHPEEGWIYIASIDSTEETRDGKMYYVTTNPPDIETLFDYDHDTEIGIGIFIPYFDLDEETVFVKCSSHRARGKLLGKFPHAKPHFFSKDPFGGVKHSGIYLLPLGRLRIAQKIKGVSKLRDQDPNNYAPCWG